MENLNEILKNAREAKGVGIEEVSRTTKIRVKILESIENGDFKNAAAPAYLRGFIKIYSDYLGLDTKSILTGYSHIFEDKTKPFLVASKEGAADKKVRFQLPNIHISFKTAVIVLSAVVFVIVSVIGFVIIKKALSGRSAAQEIAGTTADNEAAENIDTAGRRTKTPAQFGVAKINQQSGVAAPALSNVEGHVPSAVEGEEMTLTVTATDDVWLRVRADDQLVFEDTLKNGDKESWKARREFHLKMGNAGGVNLSLNNIPMGSQGASGQVKSVIIGQEDLKRLKNR